MHVYLTKSAVFNLYLCQDISILFQVVVLRSLGLFIVYYSFLFARSYHSLLMNICTYLTMVKIKWLI